MTRRTLDRRAFLRGAGTLLAIPLLESALPKVARAEAAATPPQRFMTFHFPIGVNREGWKTTGSGTSFTLGPSQEPLAPHKDDIVIIRNVGNTAIKKGTAIHTCKVATFLTARDSPRGTTSMGTSADQVIADALAGKTPFRSLELGTSILKENPNHEAGYDPVLKDHLSWWNGTPLPKTINPIALFDRLFGVGDASPDVAARRKAQRQSVIDAVREDATRLSSRLGKNDNVKLDEYLTGLRELETRVNATSGTCAPGMRPERAMDVRDRLKQLMDLSILALRCDLTRVITLGYENTVTEQTHPWVGVNEGYHIGVTHNHPGAEYAAVNKWIVTQLAYLLAKMKATPDGNGNLLDNTIVYFASEMGEGSAHSGDDVPMIVCGRGGGRIETGRLLDRPGQGNGNVLISLMHAMGVMVPSFGDGFTTPLPGLVKS